MLKVSCLKQYLNLRFYMTFTKRYCVAFNKKCSNI